MELFEFIVKAGQPASGMGGLGSMIPILLMLPIFYFFLIRPQKKQQQAHKEMISKLTKGDEIVTSSGIYGEVFAIDEKYVLLKIADKVKIKIVRSYIATIIKKSNKAS